MADNSHAYNSVWQLRGDAWCRLEEAADRLTRTTTTGELKEQYAAICHELLATLTPLEPYWAYPGSPQFAKVQRLFTAGNYDKFAHAVTRINRALTTESYRTGDVDTAGLDDTDMFPADPRTLEQQPVNTARTALLRGAGRREDDRSPGTGAAQGGAQLAQARRRVRLRAGGGGQRRRGADRRTAQRQPPGRGDPARFSHQSTRDLSALAEFVDTRVSEELDDHKSPDERAQILAASPAELRPELDMYLMTEIDVETDRRPARPLLPPGVPRPRRRARTAPVDPARRRRAVPHTVLQRAQAVQPPPDRRVPRTADLAGQVDRQLALDQGHGRLLRPRRVHGRDVGDMRRVWTRCSSRPARCARPSSWPPRPTAARHTYFVTNGTSTANKIVTQSLVAPGDIVLLDRNCHQSHHYGMMMAGANVDLPRGVSADRVLDVRRGAAAGDQVEAVGAQARPASSTGSR